MAKKPKTDWFDTVAYLLMTVFIVIFILGFIRDRWDLLAVLMIALLILCAALLTFGLNQRREARKYRELSRWMREGDPADLEGLSPPLQEEMEHFLLQAGRRVSHETRKKEMELAALQNQIDPHFLYNTLDGIRSQALREGQTEIAEMTGKLSRLFRYSVRNRGDLVTLEEELSSVEDYFSIQKYRFEERFRLSCEADPETLRYYLPKMTFQPIVENAIYHGLEPSKGSGTLVIRAERLEKGLRVIVRDDGVGMDEETLERLRDRLNGAPPEAGSGGRHSGIALYNVNRRLRLLFGDSSGLTISSVPAGGGTSSSKWSNSYVTRRSTV